MSINTKPSGECILSCEWKFHESWYPGYINVYVGKFGMLGIPRMWESREWNYCPNCGRVALPASIAADAAAMTEDKE